MSPDQLAATAAFLSGAGSVLGAGIAIRLLHKRMRKDCEERIALMKEGIKIGKDRE